MKVLLRRLILVLTGAAILAAAATMLVFASAFALFALLRPWLGAPGAAACVALAMAVLTAAVGVWLASTALGDHKKSTPAQEQDLLQKLITMAQERPLIAMGTLVGALVLAIRNPALIAILAKSLLDPKPKPGKRP